MQVHRSPIARLVAIGRAAFFNFFEHDPFQAAAALSYYSLFSLAPLVIVVAAIGGLFFSDTEIQAALVERIRDILSEDAAALVETVISNSTDTERNVVSLIIAGSLILIGATTALAQLHGVLNRIWNVRVEGRLKVWLFVKGRLWSFAFLITIGTLLAASLLFNTFFTTFVEFLSRYVALDTGIWDLLDAATSYVVTAFLLMLLYKFLPDTRVRWREAALGAAAATLLFESSKYFIRIYLAQASPGSSFGASGSIVVFMLWIYVTSLIILVGGELSCAASTIGHESQPEMKSGSASGSV
jgi:membrane protein